MKYRSVTIPEFWDLFDRLSPEVRTRAQKQFALFSRNPTHPSLRLKQVGELWSVRITKDYRALAVRAGSTFTWVWIGSLADYERAIE